MVTTLVILSMLLSFGLGAFTATKTLQMGLKYQMEMKEGVKPELNPIERFTERQEKKEIEKVNNLTEEMLNDIMNF